MAEETKDDGVRQISGKGRARRLMPWLKKKDKDTKPCSQGGCAKEGMFIPYLTIWSTNDKDHTGRYVVEIIPLVLCQAHASTDRNEYKPDEETLARLRAQLRTEEDPTAEPDLSTMVVQFVGNSRCKVDHALGEARKLAGTFEPPRPAVATRVGP